MTTEAPSYRIVDRRFQRGPGAYTSNLYATPGNTGQAAQYRPRPNIVEDLHKSIDRLTWKELVAYSRQLFAQLGNLGAAILQKNWYAVGDAWKPQFQGANTAWGEEVEEWLCNVWYPVADVRGGPFDFTTNLMLDGVAMDVDGDAAMLFTESDSGFPQVQFLAAHRIGSRSGTETEVRGGAYSGARIINGCILNREGRVVAYRILGDSEAEDVDISARDCQLLFEPEWQSQCRGVPRVSRALLDWFDIQDIVTFLKRGVKLDSSIGLLHYNEEGGPPTAQDIIADRPTTQAQDVKIEKREGGEIMYFRAGRGEKIESFNADRPHPNTDAFLSRLERRGLLAVGWFLELMDPSKIGGASVRLIQDQARHSILARQRSREARARRAVVYAIAKAMKEGFISRNDDPGFDWLRWTFTRPAQLTVDEGYSRAADIDDLKRGLTTKAEVAGKYGRWWEDVDAQRDREVRALLKRAQALKAEFDIDMHTAVDLLESRSENPPPIGSLAQQEQQSQQQEETR